MTRSSFIKMKSSLDTYVIAQHLCRKGRGHVTIALHFFSFDMAENSAHPNFREVKSCGLFVMKPDNSFLLMKHHDRYDLPKGHMEVGENEHQTALRGKYLYQISTEKWICLYFRTNGRNRN